MAKYDFSKYFIKNNRYYKPEIMITILEDILGKSITEIKSILDNSRVMVTKEQITKFLEDCFQNENPDVKRKLEAQGKHRIRKFIEDMNEEELLEHFSVTSDEVVARKYSFDLCSITYFNTHCNNLKTKAVTILDIIEKIINKKSIELTELLVKLDIELDENGNILKTDIIRLILPFVWNFNSLIKITNIANNLETYKGYKQSTYNSILKREGILRYTQDIHVLEQNFFYRPDCIHLSPKQKKLMRQQKEKNIQTFIDLFIKW